MIRQCSQNDIDSIYSIINQAAEAYQGVIPTDCYQHPYMSREELEKEMKRITFFGWEENGELAGVMGIEPIKDVTLIRHAYVQPQWQQRGIGSELVSYLQTLATTPRLLVGTWAAACWAIAFYHKHGFRLLPDKDKLLSTYWDIPRRQIETSVVMGVNTDNIKRSHHG